MLYDYVCGAAVTRGAPNSKLSEGSEKEQEENLRNRRPQEVEGNKKTTDGNVGERLFKAPDTDIKISSSFGA